MKAGKIFRNLLLAILVLGFMSGTAGAVTVSSDVKDTKYEKACIKLAALGILQGYSDDTFKPGEKCVSVINWWRIKVEK